VSSQCSCWYTKHRRGIWSPVLYGTVQYSTVQCSTTAAVVKHMAQKAADSCSPLGALVVQGSHVAVDQVGQVIHVGHVGQVAHVGRVHQGPLGMVRKVGAQAHRGGIPLGAPEESLGAPTAQGGQGGG
jgi:hypothetical protein